MLIDVLKAMLVAGIPVAAFSFLMVYLAYYKGYLSTNSHFKDAFKKNNDQQSKLSKKHKGNLLFLHSKWLTFGGGFYGLIALLTFIIIELSQIFNFLISIQGWQDISALFTISSLIAMFVDSIVNMVKAAIWFTYWPDKVASLNFLIWIIIAYLGYRLGAHLAKTYILYERQKQQ